jgi:hypothetical protein
VLFNDITSELKVFIVCIEFWYKLIAVVSYFEVDVVVHCSPTQGLVNNGPVSHWACSGCYRRGTNELRPEQREVASESKFIRSFL